MATKWKAYTVSTKLQAVAVAERSSKEAAARHFSVDPHRIREWVPKRMRWKKLRSREVPSKDDWTEEDERSV